MNAAVPAYLPRVAVGTGTAAVLLTCLVGVLHLPFAAPLLRKLSPASLCPITHGTPAQIDRAHAIGGAAIRASASARAPSRPALGFELDKTTRGDLDAWAARNRLSCEKIGGNENLRRCTDVPASAVGEPPGDGPLEEVSFELRGTGELVNVETLRRHLSPEQAVRVVVEREETIGRGVGAPSKTGGEATVAHLSRGFLSSYVAEHTYLDYRATVSATNLGETGVMAREQYLSVRP